jgi:hypothetical protein
MLDFSGLSKKIMMITQDIKTRCIIILKPSLMLSIGRRTRICDIIGRLPPSSVEEIASKSNLNERYIKTGLVHGNR